MSTLHQPAALATRSPMINSNHIVGNGTPHQQPLLLHHGRSDSNVNNKPNLAPQQQQQQPPPGQHTPDAGHVTPQQNGQGEKYQPDPAYVTNINAMAETWLAIASCCETIGDADKALAAYDRVLDLAPNNAQALTRLGNLYRHRDMFPQASEFYQRALTTDGSNGETWGLLGHCYLMLDDLQRAYAAYQQALCHLANPNVPKLWHGIGILYDRYGSLEFAEEAFARVLELDPKFEKATEIYFRLGIIYKQQNKYTQSLDCFKYILTDPPSPLTQPDVWFQIGLVLEQQRDFSGARDAYERVLQSNPRHSKVLQLLGCLYSQQPASFHDLDKALSLLSQSLELDRGDAHTWYHLGRVYMAKSNFPSAYESFQQAVNIDARNPTFWCSIGVLYYQLSQYRDALDAYTRAIRLNPYISEVWYDLGTLYETCNNQLNDALDAYTHAQTLDPSNPHITARLEQLTKYQREGGKMPPPSQEPKLPQEMIPTMKEHKIKQQQQEAKIPQLRLDDQQQPLHHSVNIPPPPQAPPPQQHYQSQPPQRGFVGNSLNQYQSQSHSRLQEDPVKLQSLQYPKPQEQPHQKAPLLHQPQQSHLPPPVLRPPLRQPNPVLVSRAPEQEKSEYYKPYEAVKKEPVSQAAKTPPIQEQGPSKIYNPVFDRTTQQPPPAQKHYPDVLNGARTAPPASYSVPAKREHPKEKEKPRKKPSVKNAVVNGHQTQPSPSTTPVPAVTAAVASAPVASPAPEPSAPAVSTTPVPVQNSDLKLPQGNPEDDDDEEAAEEVKEEEVQVREIDEDEDYDED